MGLALVTRIRSLPEAQIAAGALRSGGIEAVVFDITFGTMDAPIIDGLGGFRLMAPEEDVAAAREALKAIRLNPGLPVGDDESPWASEPVTSTRLRSKGMRIVAALFLGGPMIAWLIARALS